MVADEVTRRTAAHFGQEIRLTSAATMLVGILNRAVGEVPPIDDAALVKENWLRVPLIYTDFVREPIEVKTKSTSSSFVN
jgi:hypothetical protein